MKILFMILALVAQPKRDAKISYKEMHRAILDVRRQDKVTQKELRSISKLWQKKKAK